MLKQQKPVATFRGDWHTAIREYSFDRMERDPQYKRDVYNEINRRKQVQAREKEQRRRQRELQKATA